MDEWEWEGRKTWVNERKWKIEREIENGKLCDIHEVKFVPIVLLCLNVSVCKWAPVEVLFYEIIYSLPLEINTFVSQSKRQPND